MASPEHKHHEHAHVQRYLAQYGPRKVEANALVIRADAGRELCREAIEKYINFDAKAEFEDLTNAARGRVRERLEEFTEGTDT